MSDAGLKHRLETIGELEAKYNILGVSFFSGNPEEMTTSESAEVVEKLLRTAGDIIDGKLVPEKIDFETIDKISEKQT